MPLLLLATGAAGPINLAGAPLHGRSHVVSGGLDLSVTGPLHTHSHAPTTSGSVYVQAPKAIDDPLDQPFYTGSSTAVSVDLGPYHVALAGHRYMIDVRKYQRQTIPATAQQQDSQAEPGEASLSREGFWRRSQSRFALGAGQLFFDDDDSSRRRFYTSKGIDVWADRGIRLLPDTTQRKSSANTNLKLLSVGGYLYLVDGNHLFFTADPTVASPTFTDIDAGAPINNVATDGVYVYVATGGTLQRAAVGSGTIAAFGALTPDRIWFANGRLLGTEDNLIYEIDGVGAKPGGTNIFADPRGTAATWVAVTGSPSAIFAALNAGGTGEVYAITANDQSTALDAPTWAAGLPHGETVNALTFYASIVLIATSVGMRVAAESNRTLSYGPAVAVPGGVVALDGQAEFIWFSWTNYDSASTGLGRADLSSTTSTNAVVPAYASDLMAATQGAVTGVVSHNGKRYFVVSGHGLYGETTTLVASGSLNTGWVRFGALIDKVYSGVQVGHDPLVGQVAASITFFDGTTRSLGVSNSAGSTESELFDASGRGSAAQLILTLSRATLTTGPEVRYWVLDVLPVPKRSTQIMLPIVLGTKVTDVNRQEVVVDPLTELEFLDGLRQAGSFVTYQEGDARLTVKVDTLSVQEQDVESWQDRHARGGSPPRKWFERLTVSVRLLTKED